MTATDETLAAGRRGRERARPKECTAEARCYVEIGASGLIQPLKQSNVDRCGACVGALIDYCWPHPPRKAAPRP
jgi:hypothetical protein